MQFRTNTLVAIVPTIYPVPRFRYRGQRESIKWNSALDALQQAATRNQSGVEQITTIYETTLITQLDSLTSLTNSVLARHALTTLRQRIY